MSRNLLETVLGAVVLLTAIVFLVFAYQRSGVGQASGGYELTAQFDAIDGLDVGGAVRISGIQVGQVTGASLNHQTYRAQVSFTVADGIGSVRFHRHDCEHEPSGRQVSLDHAGR